MEMELHGLVEDVMGCGMVFNTGWMYTPFYFCLASSPFSSPFHGRIVLSGWLLFSSLQRDLKASNSRGIDQIVEKRIGMDLNEWYWDNLLFCGDVT